MISTDALQVGFLSSLTVVNEGSSLTIVKKTTIFKTIVSFQIFCCRFHNETIVFQKNENVNVDVFRKQIVLLDIYQNTNKQIHVVRIQTDRQSTLKGFLAYWIWYTLFAPLVISFNIISCFFFISGHVILISKLKHKYLKVLSPFFFLFQLLHLLLTHL